jgi:TPR repeat protein
MNCRLLAALCLPFLATACLSTARPQAAEGFYLSALRAEESGQESKAAHWYGIAAAEGHALAQNNLGLMYFEGRGVRKSYSEAACWYELSAAQGCAQAQNNLAVMKYFGLGTARDPIGAEELLMLSAAQGHEQACYTLATLNLDTLTSEFVASQSSTQPMMVTIESLQR